MAKLSPIGNVAQFINGIPANGAKLFTYASSSSTKQTTYTDEDGLTAQANPIVLDSRGEPSQPIWLTEGLSYKFVFAPSTDSDPPVSPIWDVDDITGINDSSVSIDQWVDSGLTPTYVSATQFTLAGDQTSAFTVGRRIKVLVTAGTAYGTITTSVFGAITTVTVSMDSLPLDSGLSSVQLGLITPANSSLPFNLSATSIQNQTHTAFTTAGSSSAFTLTPTPALAALTTNARFNITFDEAPTGSPTLAVSGLAATNIKYYDALGAKQFVTSTVVPINWNTDIIYDGTDWMVQKILPVLVTNKIQPISASVAANALTITLNPTILDFRSATLGSGTVNTVSNAAAISVVVSSGSTLGTINAVSNRLAVIAINNAGTMELAVVNLAGGTQLDETNLVSTTAEGGAGGADSASVVYSTTARASVAYRVVGFVESTQATAGTWATAPSTIQGMGGQAFTALSSLGYGQTWQNVTGSRSFSTTYYNTTGKPISVSIVATCTTSTAMTLVVGGINVSTFQGGNVSAIPGTVNAIVPPSQAYSLSVTGVPGLVTWSELR